MKISTAIMFLIIISAVFTIFGLMVKEANTSYTGSEGYIPINSSEWSNQNDVGNTGKYDFVTSLNTNITVLQDKWKQIKNPDEGFFSKIAAGLTAIPYAIMLVPDVVFTSLEMAGNVVTGFMTVLGIPTWFVVAGAVMLLIWGVFKLLEFFQRVPL